MLEVYPIQEKSEQEELCKKSGIPYDINKLAYKGIIDGEIQGVLQFSIKGDGGYVWDLENIKGIENEELLFVMGRAALNFIDLCGVTKNYFCARDEGRQALVSRIGYQKTEDGWFMDTTNFFTEGSCNCK